ncbi:uncharacterized protein LOC135144831 isoform X3 [Zophobas morio]|uniref:uncharacterized protein LOC135144831 isoform X3 n=1 Tax=Zophobas morio TaxID=2755281 RepID=UPI003083871A
MLFYVLLRVPHPSLDMGNQHGEYFFILGGRNAPEFIRRALSRLISNEFAILYSWLGHKGKKPFSNLKIAGVLKAVVKKFTRNSWAELTRNQR